MKQQRIHISHDINSQRINPKTLLFVTFICSIYTTHASYFRCNSTNHCNSETLTCKTNENCTVYCSGDNHCSPVNIIGPSNANLTVLCGGGGMYGNCRTMHLNATNSDGLTLRCDGKNPCNSWNGFYGAAAKVYCPKHGFCDVHCGLPGVQAIGGITVGYCWAMMIDARNMESGSLRLFSHGEPGHPSMENGAVYCPGNDIHCMIECGRYGCHKTSIYTEPNTAKLEIDAVGIWALRQSNIYCPLGGGLCDINAAGAGPDLLTNARIYTASLNQVSLSCNYTNTSDECYGALAPPTRILCAEGVGEGCAIELVSQEIDVWQCTANHTNNYNCLTLKPTQAPTENTDAPTRNPTVSPTKNTDAPTRNPSVSPTENTDAPTGNPTENTETPSKDPSVSPTKDPSVSPTKDPSVSLTKDPSVSPTKDPSVFPTKDPSVSPTQFPSVSPTQYPTEVPIIFHEGEVNEYSTTTDEFDVDEPRTESNENWMLDGVSFVAGGVMVGVSTVVVFGCVYIWSMRKKKKKVQHMMKMHVNDQSQKNQNDLESAMSTGAKMRKEVASNEKHSDRVSEKEHNNEPGQLFAVGFNNAGLYGAGPNNVVMKGDDDDDDDDDNDDLYNMDPKNIYTTSGDTKGGDEHDGDQVNGGTVTSDAGVNNKDDPHTVEGDGRIKN